MHGRLLKVFNPSILSYSYNSALKYSVFSYGFLSSTGKSADEAMSDYITKVKQLLEEAAAVAN